MFRGRTLTVGLPFALGASEVSSQISGGDNDKELIAFLALRNITIQIDQGWRGSNIILIRSHLEPNSRHETLEAAT